MSPNRNRKQPPGNEFEYQELNFDLGETVTGDTDNPEFELFDPELQLVFDARFQAGIDLTEENDILQRKFTQQASLDCAARFRASAAKRVKGIATIKDNFESGRVTNKRRGQR